MKPSFAPKGGTRRLSMTLVFVAATSLAVKAAEKVLFEEMKLGDKVVHNVQVVEANPLEVIITYDGASGSLLKRQNLPPELKALYPYDAKAAAEFEKKRQAEREKAQEEARRRGEKANQELKANLLRQRAAATQRIGEIDRELDQLRKELKVLAKQARGRKYTPADAELAQARDQELALIRRKGEQVSLLEKVNKQLDYLP